MSTDILGEAQEAKHAEHQADQSEGKLSRRKLLASIGMAGAAMTVGSLLTGAMRPVYGKGGSVTSAVYGGGPHLPFLSDKVRTATIAELRASNDSADGSIYYLTDSGQEGHFYYDSTDLISADNTGTILVSTDGHRFKRIFENSIVNVKWFGAIGDLTADDHTAITNAIQLTQSMALNGLKPTLLFPPAAGYKVTSTVIVPAGIHVIMEASLVYAGSTNEVCLAIGQAGTTPSLQEYKLNVTRSVTDWASEDNIGIKLINCNTCIIELVLAAGFTIGVQCIGLSGGFAYNEIHLGSLLNNKIALDLTNRNAGTGVGWCNENLFLNGRIWCSSSTKVGTGRMGVRITSQDGTYHNNNNNVFHKPSFELRADKASPQEALPVLIERGQINSFTDIRNEGNSTVTMRVLNNSSENEIMTGYGTVNVDDQSESASSFYRSRRNNLTEFPALVFTSEALHKKACYYDGSTAVHIPGVSFGLYSNSTIYSSCKMTLNSDYLEMSSSTDGAVGVFVDTSLCKRYVVKRDCVATNGGRIHIACYDAAGNIMTDLDGTKANAYVKAKVNYGVFWRASYFGGTYSTSADSAGDFYFNVTSNVKKIRILFWKGTAALYLRSFSIYALDQYAPAVWSGYAEAAGNMNMGISAPSSGQWVPGKVLMNSNPSVINPGSNPYTVTGWIKVTAGSTNVLGTDWFEMRTPVGS